MNPVGNSLAGTLKSLAEALRSRDFRRYSSVMFLHSVGDTAHGVAVLWLVYDSTGTALSVGFATAVLTGGRTVLSPLAGVLIDRVNRRSLLAGTQGVKAVIAGGFAAAVLTAGSGSGRPAVAAVCRDSVVGSGFSSGQTVAQGFRARCGERGWFGERCPLARPGVEVRTHSRERSGCVAAESVDVLGLLRSEQCCVRGGGMAGIEDAPECGSGEARRGECRQVGVGLPEVHSGGDGAAAAADLLLAARL